MDVTITPVSRLPLAELTPLLAASEQEGWQFIRRLCQEWQTGKNRFNQPGEVLFVARHREMIVGVCGLNADPYLAETGVGRVRRLYVLPQYRRSGIGQQLLRAIIAAATGNFRVLRVRTTAADSWYERLGFRPVSGVADCTHLLDLGNCSTNVTDQSHP
jgi:N-acetylglutamate synthase-like GNAT family acetyltransferase